jgi:hypothetical protein
MTVASTASASIQRLPWVRVALVALVATVGAAIVNVVVYLLAGALGVDWSFVVPQMGMPIPVMAPLMASLIGVGLGMLVFAALNAFTAQPVRWFTWIALVGGLISLGGPLTIPGAPLDVLATLVIMHIVAVTFAVMTPRLLNVRQAR